jgi:hypothetical protein
MTDIVWDNWIIGESRCMMDLKKAIEKVTAQDVAVLISGESGTGKELVAQTIHALSNRAEGSFQAINCAVLDDNLVNSALFGHEQGAFTGASKRTKGKIENANHGTLFLDEVNSLTLSTQGKLLRVLQEKEFERVGGSELIKSDFRLISASNSNIQSLVAEGSFREDLFYRINVVPIEVPPLRDRKKDIVRLAERFVEIYGDIEKHVISESEKKKLSEYLWPGNVRELENQVQRAIASCDNGELCFELVKPACLDSQNESLTDDQLKDIEDIIDYSFLKYPEAKSDYMLGELFCRWLLIHSENHAQLEKVFLKSRKRGKTYSRLYKIMLYGTDQVYSDIGKAINKGDSILPLIEKLPFKDLISGYINTKAGDKQHTDDESMNSENETKQSEDIQTSDDETDAEEYNGKESDEETDDDLEYKLTDSRRKKIIVGVFGGVIILFILSFIFISNHNKSIDIPAINQDINQSPEQEIKDMNIRIPSEKDYKFEEDFKKSRIYKYYEKISEQKQ